MPGILFLQFGFGLPESLDPVLVHLRQLVERKRVEELAAYKVVADPLSDLHLHLRYW